MPHTPNHELTRTEILQAELAELLGQSATRRTRLGGAQGRPAAAQARARASSVSPTETPTTEPTPENIFGQTSTGAQGPVRRPSYGV